MSAVLVEFLAGPLGRQIFVVYVLTDAAWIYYE